MATAELVASLGLPKIPARDLKRALEDAARVRAQVGMPKWEYLSGSALEDAARVRALDKRIVQAVL